MGIEEAANDKPLFLLKKDDKLHGLIVAHVDDLLVAGDEEFYKVINEIKKFIKMGKEADGHFKFCGMSFFMCRNHEKTVGVDTTKIGSVQKLKTSTTRRPLSSEEEKEVRSGIGTLQWFATLTRADFCIDLSRALSYLNREGDTELKRS